MEKLIKGDFIMTEYEGSGQIGVNDLLLARGVGGGAYGGFLGAGGYGGIGGGIGGGSFANHGSNAVRIDRNADVANLNAVAQRDLSESNFRGLTANFDTSTRAGEFARVCEKIGEVDNRNSDQSFRSELRTSDKLTENKDFMYQMDQRNGDQRFQAELRTNDRLLALQAEINANARVAAECCCDLKLKMCEDKSQVMSEIGGVKASILAVEGRAIERSLNAANAELTALKTQIACGCCTPR
jgi:hypothetical protein